MIPRIDTQSAATAAGAQADQLAKTASSLAVQAKGDAKSAAKVPEQFSKLLATMLVKEMRQALPDGFFGEGAGSDIFDGWLDEHLGSAIAARDGLRLEDMIAHSMKSKVEGSTAASAGPLDMATKKQEPKQ